mgnify:CR=1 FL=1
MDEKKPSQSTLIEENDRQSGKISLDKSDIEFFKTSNLKKGLISEEELRCDNITETQCEELQKMTFTDDPDELFSEVRSIEERYQYEIEQTKEKWAKKIEDAKNRNKQNLHQKLENRKKEINFEINQIKTEMEKNIKALEAQEKVILSHIDMLYGLHKEELVKKAIKIIGFDFLSE